mmetsp:Transcript_7829/g.11875  ORF Transcript_7829/g.11875 Transcript_7829/m.11875 type:complete len:437 (+) Transcript_7829:61-1371(+)
MVERLGHVVCVGAGEMLMNRFRIVAEDEPCYLEESIEKSSCRRRPTSYVKQCCVTDKIVKAIDSRLNLKYEASENNMICASSSRYSTTYLNRGPKETPKVSSSLPFPCLSHSMRYVEMIGRIEPNVLQDNKKESFMPGIGPSLGVSKKGYAPYNPRKRNQDALDMRTDHITETQTILLLDGHGESGGLFSNFYRHHFHEHLFSQADWLSGGISAMRQAITKSITKLEHRIIEDESIDTHYSGSTFLFCAIRLGHLFIANIGDSRIILGKTNGKAIALSVDHKPDTVDEKARIINAGGRVFAIHYEDGVDGPARVWLRDADVPGLAMSRSLGDVVAHSAGVSSTPEFFIHRIEKDDHFLLAATDGLWEFMSNEEAVNIVHTLQKNYDKFLNRELEKANCHRACIQRLHEEANRRWMHYEQVVDDTTIALTFFNQEEK